MRSRTATTTALFALLALLTAACGDKGPEASTPQEYFAQMEAVNQKMDDKNAALEEQFMQDIQEAKGDEAAMLVLRDSLEQQIAVVTVATNESAAIEPPPELKAKHDAFVSAAQTYIAMISDRLETWGDYKSPEEALNGLMSGDMAATLQKVSDACTALQASADEAKIEADLGCRPTAPEGGAPPPAEAPAEVPGTPASPSE